VILVRTLTLFLVIPAIVQRESSPRAADARQGIAGMTDWNERLHLRAGDEVVP
jgi:hypothetical protein